MLKLRERCVLAFLGIPLSWNHEMEAEGRTPRAEIMGDVHVRGK